MNCSPSTARPANRTWITRNAMRSGRRATPKLLERLRAAALVLKKTALLKSAAGQGANYTLSFWNS